MTPAVAIPTRSPAAFRRWVLAALAAAAVVLGPAAAGRAQLILDEVPSKIRGMEIEDHSGEQVPLDLEFTDSAGRQVTLAELVGRPLFRNGQPTDGRRPVVLLMMYFRCPLLCPKVLSEAVSSLNGLDELTAGGEFDFLAVSFDPRDGPVEAERERIKFLMDYRRNATENVRTGVTFLTGSAVNSRALADSIGFPYRYDSGSGEFSHPSVLFVLTPDGKVSRYLIGLQFPTRDLRLALVEAADGRIGTFMDRFTLWCYHFDPREGSYVLQAFRVMQAGAILTVILLSGFLGVMFLGERRRRLGRAHIAAAGAARAGTPAGAGASPHRTSGAGSSGNRFGGGGGGGRGTQ